MGVGQCESTGAFRCIPRFLSWPCGRTVGSILWCVFCMTWLTEIHWSLQGYVSLGGSSVCSELVK